MLRTLQQRTYILTAHKSMHALVPPMRPTRISRTPNCLDQWSRLAYTLKSSLPACTDSMTHTHTPALTLVRRSNGDSDQQSMLYRSAIVPNRPGASAPLTREGEGGHTKQLGASATLYILPTNYKLAGARRQAECHVQSPTSYSKSTQTVHQTMQVLPGSSALSCAEAQQTHQHNAPN